MITFQGNKKTLKSAKNLERNAKNIYPHMSTSRIRKQIGYDTPDPLFFKRMKKDYSSARQMIRESGDIYTALVYSLKYGGIGNCTEDSLMTELLGKVNGQKNIYTGSLGLYREGKSEDINHVIAFITDKPVETGKKMFFRNKDAIIIDPWLGITDFAENYFTKLKTIFRKIFMQEKSKEYATFTNDNFTMELIRAESKTPKEFKAKRKEYCPAAKICVIPFVDNSLNAENIEIIKETFPELILKNFKKIILSGKK